MGVFLLIVAGLVAWFFIAAMMKANRRMAYADAQSAKRDVAELETPPHRKPSWVQSRDRQEEFVHGVLRLAERNGTPVSYGGSYFTEENKVGELMHYIAMLERRGASFSDQQIAATEFIMERFQGLPDVIRQHFVGASLAPADRGALPTWARSKPDVDAFVEDMYVLVENRSIPPQFFTALITDPDTIGEMMREVARSESEGGSLDDQKAAAGQLVFDRWLVLPHEEQEPFRDQQFRAMMGDAYRPPAG